jgi:hypothetical protein
MKPKMDLTKRSAQALLLEIWDTPKLYKRRYDDSILDLFVYTDLQYNKFRDALNVDFNDDCNDSQETY